MKITFKTEIIPLLVLAITVAASFYFYSVFPERVPVHWGITGQVDGWGSRATGAFAIPGMLVGMYILFLVLPYLDPKRERYEQFAKTYLTFRTLIISFLAVIYFIASLSAMGYNISVGFWIPILVGLLFVFIGNFLAKVKMNWFMGIRTPWTMSSEEVWNKTHRAGSKMFILAGLLMMLTAFVAPIMKVIVFITAMVIILGGTIGYSYWLYRGLKNK